MSGGRSGAHPLIEPTEIKDGRFLTCRPVMPQTHAGFDKLNRSGGILYAMFI
jgi:hypothetical protein